MTPRLTAAERLRTMTFASVYPLYVNKVEKKGKTVADLHQVISWLTGYDDAAIQDHIDRESTFEQFFAEATMHANVGMIKGVVCGIRVEEVEDELVRKGRYLDKLIDELARGKKMESILRK